MYSEDGNELWSEESANQAIKSMLKSLNEAYGLIDYSILFHTALKLEKTDFQLSYNIMQMLSRMIPNDSNIQSKLNNYVEFIKQHRH